MTYLSTDTPPKKKFYKKHTYVQEGRSETHLIEHGKASRRFATPGPVASSVCHPAFFLSWVILYGEWKGTPPESHPDVKRSRLHSSWFLILLSSSSLPPLPQGDLPPRVTTFFFLAPTTKRLPAEVSLYYCTTTCLEGAFCRHRISLFPLGIYSVPFPREINKKKREETTVRNRTSFSNVNVVIFKNKKKSRSRVLTLVQCKKRAVQYPKQKKSWQKSLHTRKNMLLFCRNGVHYTEYNDASTMYM